MQIGHTKLTESYKMESRTVRDKCSDFDTDADHSKQHVMRECFKYRDLSKRVLPGDTLEEIISHLDITIVEFLREAGLINCL